MSLTHILKVIDQKTDAELVKILAETKAKKTDIIKAAETEAADIKARTKTDFQNKTLSQVEKARRQAEAQVKERILIKKREILTEVFEQAITKITADSVLMERLLEQLIKQLPADDNGQIIASADSAPIVKKIMERQHLSYPLQADLKEPGFQFAGQSVDVDNRLPKLIDGLRRDIEIDVAKLLFE